VVVVTVVAVAADLVPKVRAAMASRAIRSVESPEAIAPLGEAHPHREAHQMVEKMMVVTIASFP
jgi:hypothetical protein